MNRWVVRAVGILMLLGFILLFANLQRRLVEMKGSRRAAPARSR